MSWTRNAQFIFQGLSHFTKDAYLRTAKGFDVSATSCDLTGRTCVVTGANAGIGYQVAKDLASRGAEVYMLVRDAKKGKAALDAIQEATGTKVLHVRACDVSDMTAVKSFAGELVSKHTRLYLLVNNAGVMVSERKESKEGFEYSFATNTLGMFALTCLLAPCLAREAPESRVVTVASGGAYTEPLVVHDLEMEGHFDGTAQYARDKRRQIALMERFAELFAPLGVGAYSMHPGWVDTQGLALAMPAFYRSFQGKMRSLEQGADTILWLALQPNSALEGGALYLDRKVQAKHMFLAGTKYTRDLVDELWLALEAKSGVCWSSSSVIETGQAQAPANLDALST